MLAVRSYLSAVKRFGLALAHLGRPCDKPYALVRFNCRWLCAVLSESTYNGPLPESRRWQALVGREWVYASNGEMEPQ